MEGCFKWLIILIILSIVIPIIIGGGLLAGLGILLSAVFSDCEATLGFIFFVLLVVIVIALVKG